MKYARLVGVFTLFATQAEAAAPEGREVGVITDEGHQRLTMTLPDGSGGHYIAYWQKRDAASTNMDAYVHRVGGSAPWARPVRVSDGASESATEPLLARTSTGILVVYRTMSFGLHVQRLSAAGLPSFRAAKRIANNVRIFHGIEGIGNSAYLAYAGVAPVSDRYMFARVNSEGGLDWSKDLGDGASGGPLPGNYNAALCRTTSGDAVLALPGSQVRTFRFDPRGAARWGEAGRTLTRAFGVKTDLRLHCLDDGAFVGFTDHRRGETVFDPYVQRVDESGNAAFPADVEIARDASGLSITRDDQGGAFVAFTKTVPFVGSPFPLQRPFLVRLRKDGAVVLGGSLGLVLEPERYNTRNPVLTRDGSGGVFVAWQAAPTSGSASSIACLAMRQVDASGAFVWGESPTRTGRCDAYPSNQVWSVHDNALTLTFSDPRSGYVDIYQWTATIPTLREVRLPSVPEMTPPAPTPPFKLPSTPGLPLPKITPPRR